MVQSVKAAKCPGTQCIVLLVVPSVRPAQLQYACCLLYRSVLCSVRLLLCVMRPLTCTLYSALSAYSATLTSSRHTVVYSVLLTCHSWLLTFASSAGCSNNASAKATFQVPAKASLLSTLSHHMSICDHKHVAARTQHARLGGCHLRRLLL